MSNEDCSLTEMLGKWNEDDCGLVKPLWKNLNKEKYCSFWVRGYRV